MTEIWEKTDLGPIHSILKKSTIPKKEKSEKREICHPLWHQMAQIKGCCALQLSNKVVLSLSFIHAPKVCDPN